MKHFITGGTAAYYLDLTEYLVKEFVLETPYGLSGVISELEIGDKRIGFLSRHGRKRLEYLPIDINYQANLWAIKELGAIYVWSWNGVGAINPELKPSDLAVVKEVLDFSKDRLVKSKPVPVFNTAMQEALGLDRAVIYAASEGPHLETKAEIRLMGQWGADVVGMTLIPEAPIAASMGLEYAALSHVSNYATGVKENLKMVFGIEVAERCMQVILEAIGRYEACNGES